MQEHEREAIDRYLQREKALDLPVLTDPETLQILGDEILYALQASEILVKLRDEYLTEEEPEYRRDAISINRYEVEGSGISEHRVINLCSLSWTPLEHTGVTAIQSVSIGVLDGKYLGYYVGEGDPKTPRYEGKLWDSLSNPKSDFDPTSEGELKGDIYDLRPFVANQTILYSSPGLLRRSEELYEQMAEEVCVFYY